MLCYLVQFLLKTKSYLSAIDLTIAYGLMEKQDCYHKEKLKVAGSFLEFCRCWNWLCFLAFSKNREKPLLNQYQLQSQLRQQFRLLQSLLGAQLFVNSL